MFHSHFQTWNRNDLIYSYNIYLRDFCYSKHFQKISNFWPVIRVYKIDGSTCTHARQFENENWISVSFNEIMESWIGWVVHVLPHIFMCFFICFLFCVCAFSERTVVRVLLRLKHDYIELGKCIYSFQISNLTRV